jgi:hypothetical protein
MFTSRRVTAVFGAIALIGALGFTGVGEGLAGPTGGAQIIVVPTTVSPGDSFEVSNDPSSPCFLGEVSGDTGGMHPHAWFTTPDESGNWSITLQVPTEGPPDPTGQPTPFPPGDYEIHAFCHAPSLPQAGEGDQGDFAYDPATITVVAGEEPPPPPPAVDPSDDEPADVVAASPQFTG